MNSELPIQLYKANAELQLQITRLLQESGHHWLEAMQQLSAGSMLETTSRIQNLQQAADWQALATLPTEVFWRLSQGRMGDAQAVGQAAVKNPDSLCRWPAPIALSLAGIRLRGIRRQWRRSHFHAALPALGAALDRPKRGTPRQDQEMRGRQ